MNKKQLIAIIKEVKKLLKNDFFEDGSFENEGMVYELLDRALEDQVEEVDDDDDYEFMSCLTIAGVNQYDYPYTVNPVAISGLFIDDREYKKMKYNDFIKFTRSEKADHSTKRFTEKNKKIFIFPTPQYSTDMIAMIRVKNKKQSNN